MSEKVTDHSQNGAIVASDVQVARLTEENAQLKQDMQRLTERWQRDQDIIAALIAKEFPRTEEELQAALAESEPFSDVLKELFPEQVAKA